MNIAINRRNLLTGAGALTVSVVLPGASARAATVLDKRPALDPQRLSTYVSVNADGSAVGWIGKVDMGQGTEMGWVQIMAEELDLPVERVSVVQGHTDVTINMGGASGSTGVAVGGAVMRNAAAEARLTLLQLASTKLGVPVDQLVVNDGVVSAKGDPAKRVSYGDLIGGKFFDVELEWNKQEGSSLMVKGKASPKKPADYRIVGKTGIRRRDVAPKVLGELEFMVDAKTPGMQHGRMIRPTVAGAVPTVIDEASVKDIPGVKVVWKKGFLGVVAPREWDAIKASRQLKVTWSDAKPNFPTNTGLYAHIRNAKPVKRDVEKTRGDIDAAFARAARVIEAEYEWPFQSHAPMSPACGLADVRNGEATVWSGTQKPHYGGEGIAKMLNLPIEKVKVISMSGPGSYGRNNSGDAAMDAAVLSQAVGAPVRVQGMRHEGHGWDPKAPASVHTSRVALDKDNKVIGWQFVSRAFSKRDFLNNEGSPEHTLAGQLMDLPLKPVLLFGPPENDYGFEAIQTVSEIVAPLLDRASPLRSAHLRDPGGPQTHFAVESFIDEVAYALAEDPLAFRLKYISNERDKELVRATAEKAGWQPRTAARKQQVGDNYVGQGMSYVQRGGTRVVIIAEVEVNRQTGRVWAKRFTVGHDCGQVINPDLLRMTIEGNIVQSTSRALFEEVKFDDKMVTSIDWTGYPIVDMKDAPGAIDILLMDRPGVAPTGAGEATTRPTAAALANAIFDATGVRLRQAPLTPERIKQGFV